MALKDPKAKPEKEDKATGELKAETEKTDAEPSAGFSVYLGPNIPGLIQKGTIYPVGRTAALELPELAFAISRKPRIAELVVDGLTLPEDRIKVNTKGTELAKAYAAVLRK